MVPPQVGVAAMTILVVTASVGKWKDVRMPRASRGMPFAPFGAPSDGVALKQTMTKI